jgi:hypothetical protein
MFAKDKVTQSMIDAVKQVVETAPIKEPTPTGMRVYGGSYGNSAKAKQDQTKKDIDNLKGPKDKEMKEAAKPDFLDMDKDGNKKESMKKAIADKKAMGEELKGNQDKIDANHNNKIDAQDFAILRGKKKVKEGREFAEKLLASINEKKDVVLPEETPAKNTDIADKSYLKDMGKKPTVKSDLKNLGRFLIGKKETNEDVELTEEQLDEMINEVLGKDASAGDYIHDFIHSDNPKFAGKSKAERKKMALGAYYGKQNEETYKNPDEAPITTDTLAGRMPGGKMNSFKSYKIGVKPSDKEGDGSVKEVDCEKADSTAARKSIHTEETVEEATIAGTSGWEKIKGADKSGNIKDKSGATHTPMSRAKDLARQAFKKIKNETMMGKISN